MDIGNGFLKLDLGSWILKVGYWKLGLGSWTLDLGSWRLDLGSWMLEVGHWNLLKTTVLLYSSACPSCSVRQSARGWPPLSGTCTTARIACVACIRGAQTRLGHFLCLNAQPRSRPGRHLHQLWSRHITTPTPSSQCQLQTLAAMRHPCEQPHHSRPQLSACPLLVP